MAKVIHAQGITGDVMTVAGVVSFDHGEAEVTEEQALQLQEAGYTFMRIVAEKVNEPVESDPDATNEAASVKAPKAPKTPGPRSKPLEGVWLVAFGRDSNGNPVIITPDMLVQTLYAYLTGGAAPEVKSESPSAAGEADITFNSRVNAVTVSATVDVYVAFDASSVSATTGFYVPAKVPIRFPIGCTKLNVYATGSGTVTAIGEHW